MQKKDNPKNNAGTLQNIQNRIFNKKKETNIIDTYHYLMIHYGYIPFEDFKKMDAYLVEELLDRLEKLNRKPTKRGGKW